MKRLKKLLDTHEIRYENAKNGSVKGYNYKNQSTNKFAINSTDLVVHTNQPKGKMVKVLFEPNAKLADSLTYDITAWSLPYAHGINAIASKTKVNSTKRKNIKTYINTIDNTAYAYLSKWNSLDDATFLGALLQQNIVSRFTEKAFSAKGTSFDKGTLIILRNDNRNLDFDAKLISIANKYQRNLTAVSTGFSETGVDFGSYSVKPIKKQKIAVISGKATSSLSFGEVWHFFETQLQYPITNINSSDFSRTNLSTYDVLILPSGNYSDMLNKKTLTKVKKWTRAGGTVLAIGNALQSFADTDDFALKTKKPEEKKDSISDNLTLFSDRVRESVADLITGSIFKGTLDNSHPLAFGYGKNYFSLKLSGTSYSYLKEGYNVGYFNEETKNVSGYAGSKASKEVSKSLLFGEEQMGNGSIIYMVDNPLFRSFWENGKLFVANAVFLLNSDVLK